MVWTRGTNECREGKGKDAEWRWVAEGTGCLSSPRITNGNVLLTSNTAGVQRPGRIGTGADQLNGPSINGLSLSFTVGRCGGSGKKSEGGGQSLPTGKGHERETMSAENWMLNCWPRKDHSTCEPAVQSGIYAYSGRSHMLSNPNVRSTAGQSFAVHIFDD